MSNVVSARPAAAAHDRPERLDPRTTCRLLARHPHGGPVFWDAVRAQGTPLVDELPGDPAHRAVTFLHPAGPDVERVHVLLDRDTGPQSRAGSPMTLLPGTDVWAAGFRMDARWRGSYAVAPVPAGGRPPPVDPRSDRRRQATLAAAHPLDRAEVQRWFDDTGHAVADPLARETVHDGSTVVSAASLPLAPPQLWPATPSWAGSLALSTDLLTCREQGGQRPVWAHHPTIADPTSPLPVVLLLDGERWLAAGLAVLLDGMQAIGALPPMLVVGVGAVDPASRAAELRGTGRFVDLLRDRVLPWASQGLSVSADPARTVLVGQGPAGPAALHAVHAAPERFGRALVQSGAFDRPTGPPGSGREWATDLVRSVPRPTAGVFLELGSAERGLLGPTRRLRDALGERGDAVIYREYCGGHDPVCWRAGLADGLLALTADWP